MGQGKVTVDIIGQNKDLKQSLGESTNLMKRFKQVAVAAFVAVGAAKLVAQIGRIGKALFELYSKQIQAETRLAAVVKATGEAAGFSADQMKILAAQMQQQIGIGDEIILNTQAILATFKNIRGDVFKDATLSLFDMAAVLGTDASSAAVQLGKALNDPVKGITALSRVGVSFSQQQKDQIQNFIDMGEVAKAQQVILDELKGEFGGAAEALSNTFGGRVQRLKNDLGDLGEQIFGIVLPAFEAIIPMVANVVNFIKNLTTSVGNASGGFIAFVENGINFVISGFKLLINASIVAFTVIETTIENFVSITLLALQGWWLHLLRTFEQLRHVLTVVIPTTLKFLFDNWRDVFTDIANFTKTVLTNMFQNVLNFMEAMESLFLGQGFNFEFVGLTEGFERSLRKMPQIAEREVGQLEQGLAINVKRLQDKVSGAFNDNLKKNRAVFEGLTIKQAEQTEEIVANQEALDAEFAISKSKEKKKKTQREKESAGQAVGLEQLAQDITKAAAAVPIEEKIAENMEAAKEAIVELPKKIQEEKEAKGVTAESLLVEIRDVLSNALANLRTVPDNVENASASLASIEDNLPGAPVI